MERLVRLQREKEYIAQHGKTTAENLAKAMGVSRKTIYRDMEFLSWTDGFESKKGNGGGIQPPEWFRMDRTMLANKQRAWLMDAIDDAKKANKQELAEGLNSILKEFGSTRAIDADRLAEYAEAQNEERKQDKQNRQDMQDTAEKIAEIDEKGEPQYE